MIPIIILSMVSFATILLGLFRFRPMFNWLIVAGVFFAGIVAIFLPVGTGMMVKSDAISWTFSVILIGLTFLILNGLPTSVDILDRCLIVVSLVGAVVAASFSHFVLLFLGIEMVSVPVYCLIARNSGKSLEAAIKYFVFGAVATAMIIFGFALLYSGTAQMSFPQLLIDQSVLISGGIILLLAGLAIKLGAAPFHFWAPDVYEGAPIEITMFLSVVPKIAVIAVLVRLVMDGFFSPLSTVSVGYWMGVLAVVSIVIGNLGALVTRDRLVRMFAYSSVAHVGYILIGLMNSHTALDVVAFYSVGYGVAAIGFFWSLIAAKATDSHGISGLARRSPVIGTLMVVSLVSMTGIPLTVGFVAKYCVFITALAAGHLAIVMVAIVGSVTGAVYYLRLLPGLFDHSESELVVSKRMLVGAIAITMSLIGLGLFPSLLIR